MLQLKVWYKATQNRLKVRRANGYRELKFWDPLMTDDSIFSKNALI